MKNIYDILRQKEAELLRLQREVEALRTAAQLLVEDDDKPLPEAKEQTQMQMIRTVLVESGHPLRLVDIAAAIERKFRKRVKPNNLSSLIYRNLKSKNKVLRKEDAPNTFGLIEWPVSRTNGQAPLQANVPNAPSA